MKKTLVVAVSAAMVLLAGCSGGDGGNKTGDKDQLTILAEDVPAGLDGDGPSGAIPASQTGIDNLMEPLIGYKLSGESSDSGVKLYDFTKFEGRLAESFSFDEKTLTWTLKLRQGVKGCDGATFNADDVLYTFARAKSVSGAAPIGWFLSNVAGIKNFTADVLSPDKKVAAAAQKLGDEVKKVDDHTVQIQQSSPNKLFLPVLTIFGLMIYDKETMEKHATPEDPWSHDYANNENAPSFGAYCLDTWKKNSEFTVKANPDYYGGAPDISRVIYRKVPESANRLAAVKTGAAQLVEHLTPSEYASLKDDANVEVQGVRGNENMFIHMNFNQAPYNDPKFRQAIAHALNYDAIISTGYFGKASKWEGQVPSSYPGFHKPDLQYDYDVDKAKSLLAESSYESGTTLQLSYVAEKESTLGPIATQIRADLAAVGVKVELDPLPQTQYGDRQLVKKDLPFAINDQEKPIGVDAGYAALLFFVSGDKGGLNNMVNYSSAKVDKLYQESSVEGDVDKRNALLAELQDQVQADLAWVPVVEYDTQWAHSKNLKGLTWDPDNSVRWASLSLD